MEGIDDGVDFRSDGDGHFAARSCVDVLVRKVQFAAQIMRKLFDRFHAVDESAPPRVALAVLFITAT
jgi:hypothetical protein